MTLGEFLKRFWREILFLILLSFLWADVREAKQNAEYAYDYAATAADYAQNAYLTADEAASNAEDAYYAALNCSYY